jgi:GntR family transcriptional regulator
MLDVKIDRDAPVLLHDQVAAQIRRAIADGEAKPGERLPPARHLAAVMHVNTNTVLRALRLLRDEGLLELRPGQGIRVSGTPERSNLLAKAVELVQIGRESGYDRAELLAIIEQLP